jgi:hypothetical protein
VIGAVNDAVAVYKDQQGLIALLAHKGIIAPAVSRHSVPRKGWHWPSPEADRC